MSTQEKIFRGTPFYYFSIILTAIIMFCFHLLPTFGSVTTTGLWVIGIFIGLVWGWSTCDLLVPSIMGLVAFGFSGLYDNVTASFSAGIGNQNTLILIVLFVILGVLQVSGITKWMGIKLTSLKIARGKPWVLVFVLFFTSYALQALSGSMAACLLVWTIFYDMVAVQKIEKGPFTQFVIFGIIVAGIFAGQLFPFTWVVLTLTNTYSSVSGLPAPSYAPYMLWMFVIHMVVFVAMIFFARVLFRIKAPDIQPNNEAAGKLDAFQKISLALLIAFIVLLTGAGLLPQDSAIAIFLNKFSVVGMAALVVIVIFGLRFKKAVSFEEYMANATNWSLIFTVAVVSVLSSAISADSTGILPWVNEVFSPLFAGTSRIVFIILITLIPAILTNFLNNLVMGVIFIPISYTFATALGLNPVIFCVMLIHLVSVATMTAAGCQPAAILHANTEWITSRQAFKFGTVLTIVNWALTLIIGYPLASILF